jgi:hypothetical protein
MAGQTGNVLISISHDALVLLIGFRVQMAGNASKLSIIGRIPMTFQALVPDSFVLASIHRKVHTIVIKGRRCPGFLAVAFGTILGKFTYGVIGIFGLIKIGLVASYTGIRRIAEPFAVTGLAVVGYDPVCVPEHVILIVDVKPRRAPARIGGMAGSTIS